MTAQDEEPRLVEHLKPALDERGIGRVWRAIEDGRHPASTKRTRRAPLLIAAFGVALAAGAAVFLSVQRADAPLVLARSSPLPANLGDASAVASYDFVDGSHLDLSAGADATIVRNDGSEIVTVLRKGKTTFDVRPGGKRRWTIEAGVLTVQVLGTRFAVDRVDGRVRVAVERGVVLVRGERVPDRVRRLGAGQAFELSENDATAQVEASVLAGPALQGSPVETAQGSATGPQGVTVEAPTTIPSVPEAATDAVRAEPGWQHWARRGSYVRAFRALESEGVEQALRDAPDTATLLDLADVARRSKADAVAALALHEALRRVPNGPEALIAAFTLGKLEQDSLGRRAEASEHFAWVVKEGGESALVEDALARLVDISIASDAHALARERAQEYLRRFPHGRRRVAMEHAAKAVP